jgi:hypothetical protein
VPQGVGLAGPELVMVLIISECEERELKYESSWIIDESR